MRKQRVLLSIIIFIFFGGPCPCLTAFCGFPGTSLNSRVEFSSDSLTTGTFAAYSCDDGYLLLGSKSRYCLDEGKWSGSLPVCVVNVALSKPVNASSFSEGGVPENGNDGKTDIHHRKQFCVETNKEQNPWWRVDLLGSFEVFGVQLVANGDADSSQQASHLEIRVGNSTNASENKLCAWIPEMLESTSPKEIQCAVPLRGRYVSIHSAKSDLSTLTFCEVQVYSSQELPTSKCPVQSAQTYVFQHRCYDIHVEAKSSVAKASKDCQDNSGTLATRIVEPTHLFLAGALKRLEQKHVISPQNNVWIGLSRFAGIQPWNWHWQNNATVNETFWADGQPNEFDSHAPVCVALASDLNYRWKDLQCNLEAHWICQYDPIICGSPEIKPNSTIVTKRGLAKITDSIQYHCELGNQMLGSPNRTCLRDGAWSMDAPDCRYVDCGLLPKVTDAVAFLLQGRSTYGGEAEYACTGNFSLIGNSRTHCSGDGWSGSPPECRYVNCGFLPPIANGAALMIDGGTFYKARARYECTENYTLVGPTVLTCNERSIWNDSVPICKLKECAPVAPFINGKISGSNYSLGMQLNYICDEGFYLSADFPNVRTCMPDQRWSTDAPTCIPIDCGMPDILPNGTFSLLNDGTTYNKTVLYGCETNFLLVGDQQRHCSLAGAWSGTSPHCAVSACNPPKLEENQILSVQNFSVGAVLEFGCAAGYRVKGPQNYTCHHDGYWTGSRPLCHFLDCGPPPVVKHGSLRTSTPLNGLGTIATYSCDKNTTMLGEPVIYCTETESWSGYAPTCVGCGPPEFTSHAILEGADYSLNATLNYSCEPGYKLIGEPQSICRYPGKWSGQAPICEEIFCQLPPHPVNGSLSPKKAVKVGSSVRFACNHGNVLTGSSLAHCLLNGTWDAEPPICRYVTCGMPVAVKHANATYNGISYGSFTKYICNDPDLHLHGKSEIFCLESGKWDIPPECNTTPPEESTPSGLLLDDDTNVIPRKAAENGTNTSSQLGMGIGIAVACLLVVLTIAGSVIWIKVRGRKTHTNSLPSGRSTYVDPNFSFRPKGHHGESHVHVTKAYANEGFDSTAL